MSQLEDLLQQCTVKLTLPDRLGWGTGFFVAPGWILTCAHVVQEARDESIQVRWQKQENWAQATVERSLADPFDLALLRVTGSTEVNPPCVYFDEEIRSRDPLYLFGYPDQDFPNGCPVTFNCEGLTGDESALIKFALGQVRPGMSGSPLLNQRTGKVCGMVKFTRDRSFDLGGGAIPTQVILAQFPELRSLQQAFHGGDRRWVNLITQPGIDFQPYLRSLIANEKYQQKWGFYTPTDAVGKIQPPRAASELDIGLMVQLMQPKKAEDDGTPKQEEKTERLLVLEGIRKYAADHVLLMGRPGSGKSTALLSLLVEAAQQALADPSASIPVLVELRYLEADRPSVLERIGAFLQSHALSVEEATLRALLAEGKLLLLIDGVNELPSESARRAVARFRQDYAKTPMIFTTRDMAIGGDVGIEKKLEMQPLNESQMRQFVRAYLPEQGEPMLRQLQGRLREVGQTPLLLWMLCQVFQGLQQIPTSLGLLFRWFAGEYDKLKRDVPVSEGLRHWQSDLLQQLAFAMMQAEEPTELRVAIPRPEAETLLAAFLQGKVDYPAQRAKEWLEDLLEHHLIQPTGQNQLEFHHQLLQEYYAAEYLLKLLPTLTDDQLKQDYLNYLKWTEPVALVLAMVEEEAQALRVVKLAMDEVDLMLGARLAGEVRPTFQTTAIGWIDAKMLSIPLKICCWEASRSEAGIAGLLGTFSDSRSGIRLSAVEALERISDERSIDGLLSALNDSDYDVRKGTVETLERIGSERAIDGLLSALNNSTYDVRKRSAEALGRVGGKKAFDGLLNALSDSHDGVFQEAAKALGKIGDERAVDALLNAVNGFSGTDCSEIAWALGRIGGERAINGLLNILNDSSEFQLRWSAITALGKIGDERAVDGLLSALNDSKDYYCYNYYGSASLYDRAAEALEWIGGKRAVDGLLGALNDPGYFYGARREAAKALGRIGSEEAIGGLLNALNHSDNDVHLFAAWALGKIGDERAVDGLLNALNHSKDYVRKMAVEVLERVGGERSVDGLLSALNHSDKRVRYTAAEALGRVGSERVVDGVLNALNDSDYYVRKTAAEALGKIGSERAIDGLLSALNDSSYEVHKGAVAALGKIGGEKVVDSLLSALNHSNCHVRKTAAEALGKIGSERAIDGLLNALNDSYEYARYTAAEALGKIGSERAIEGLLSALNHSDSEVRSKAVSALAQIGSERAIDGLLSALNDSNSSVRSWAVLFLGRRVGSERAIGGLLNVLNDLDSKVRNTAAEALGKIGSERAIEGLLSALNHSNCHVRNTAAEALGKIGSERAIEGLLNVLNDLDSKVRNTAAEALNKIDSARFLAELWHMCQSSGDSYLWGTISAIQNRCKYYNYEIWQTHLAVQKADRPTSQTSDPNAITIQTLERLNIMTDKPPIFNQQHATIGVNYAAEGSNIEFTQHTSASKQTFEVLLTDYQQFIEQLQQKYPTVADPTTVPRIIEVEAKLIEAQDHHRWQNFLNLKRLWNGSKKAGVKVGEHFAENNVWAKGAIAFLEGVSEDEK